MVWNPIIRDASMSAAMMAKRIRAANPFGVVHLMIRRRGRVSVVVKLCFSPMISEAMLFEGLLLALIGKHFGYLSQLDDCLARESNGLCAGKIFLVWAECVLYGVLGAVLCLVCVLAFVVWAFYVVVSDV